MLSFCLEIKILPSVFFISTVEPGLTNEPFSPCAVSVKPELLIAVAMSPAVANEVGLFGVFTLPVIVSLVNGDVLATILPSTTSVVTPSVFAATV